MVFHYSTNKKQRFTPQAALEQVSLALSACTVTIFRTFSEIVIGGKITKICVLFAEFVYCYLCVRVKDLCAVTLYILRFSFPKSCLKRMNIVSENLSEILVSGEHSGAHLPAPEGNI